MQDVHHFQLPHSNRHAGGATEMIWYHARLRPGTRKFLAAAAKKFELHICTFGARPYAHAIARILDPKGELFSSRILSRDECFHPTQKTSNLKYFVYVGIIVRLTINMSLDSLHNILKLNYIGCSQRVWYSCSSTLLRLSFIAEKWRQK